MKLRTKVILPFLLLAAACATHYEKEGLFSNGYSDFREAGNTFIVTFRANEYTPEEKVMKYALARAAELTLKHGYSYFVVVDVSKLSYPSIRLKIQCFAEKPPGDGAIDAQNYLQRNKK